MRTCSRCLKDLPDDSFGLRRGGQLNSYCKTCRREYGREHYQKNAREYNERRGKHQRRYREENKRILETLKDRPCADCGEKHPVWAMDFDHRDPAQKLFTIGEEAKNSISKERLLAEIEKCDVVCALCHRYRTYGQKRGIAQR